MPKKSKRINYLENKENKIYSKLLDMLRETTIACSHISGIELTEQQLQFIFSASFRKVVLKEKIKIITKLLYGEENDIEIDTEKEISNKIEIKGVEKCEFEITKHEKNKK